MTSDLRSGVGRRRRQVRTRIRRAYLLIGVILLVAVAVVGWNALRRNDAVSTDERLWRPGQVAARDLLAAVIDQETGERGFIVTGDRTYLAPYLAGRERSLTIVAQLRALYAEEPELLSLIDDAATSIGAWWTDAAEVEITLAQTDLDAARAAVATGVGRDRLDRVRADLDQLVLEIDARSHAAGAVRDRSFVILLVAVAIGLVALAVAGVFVVRRAGRWVELRQALLDNEVQLREQNEVTAALLDALIDEAPIGLGFLDLGGRFERANPALTGMSGGPPQDAVGRTIAEVLPDLAHVVEPSVREVILTRRPVRNVEVERVPAGGRGPARQWLAGFYPVEDAVGELHGVGAVAVEITDVRRVEARLRAVVSRLQASLLPSSLPSTPGFDVAVHYVAASEDTDVGGDFYDVTLRPRGGLAVTIGDVCGHDIEAAVLTGVVRHTVSAASHHLDDPVEVLTWANLAVLAKSDDFRFVTAVHAQLRAPGEDGAAEVELAVAGHPLPILVRSDGAVAFVGAHGRLLGVTTDLGATTTRIRLQPGDRLIFYTDGLLENPVQRLDDAALLGLVADVVAESAVARSASASPSTDEFVDRLLARYDALERRPNCDDVAIVVIARSPDRGDFDQLVSPADDGGTVRTDAVGLRGRCGHDDSMRPASDGRPAV